jgi:hypothetical protein
VSGRPDLPPAHRAARLLAALALGAALAACQDDDGPACPGELVAVVDLAGARSAAACVAGPPVEGGYGAVAPERLPAQTLALHVDAATGLAFACTGRREAVAFSGTRAGDAWTLAAETTGAVLGACGGRCTTRVTQRMEATLLPAAPGAPGALEGTLTEVQDAVDPALCDGCTLPCTATWALEGQVR